MYEYLDKRYALALYEVAEKKGKIEEYLTDLREIVDLVKEDADFQTVIRHPQISTAKKREIFIKVFKNRIDEELLSFLLILIDKDRILYIEEKLSEMEKIYLEKENTLRAEVRTVIPLNNSQKNILVNKLEGIYNKKIILNEKYDESIIGGVYIRVGDDVIDGTITSKLLKIKKIMLNGEKR